MPARVARLTMLRRVLNGTLYDQLRYAFAVERNDAGEYIPLRERRPSVRTNLCRIVVDDSVSLLFGEGNFPAVQLVDKDQQANLQRLLREAQANSVMLDAATRGSIGSAAIMLQILRDRVFLKVLDTENLTPQWDPEAPDTLLSVTEQYKALGSTLAQAGYTIDPADSGEMFWFRRVWDAENETWYQPWKVANLRAKPKADAGRSVKHALGFVPIAWIKNLPGGDDIDGAPTLLPEAIDCQIEVDYQLSQAGRGLKFMSDPTLVLKNDAGEDEGQTIKGAANALVVGEKGDAKLLEINGNGVAAVIDYVKHLREVALEVMHGNRASNEKIAAAQSGRAMELMNQPLIWLADKLRVSYGEGGLLELAWMVIRASQRVKLLFKDGTKAGDFDQARPTLRWPPWFAPTLADMQSRAATLKALCDAGLMSRETAIKILCAEYDIADAAAEKSLADADMAQRNAGAQVQAKIVE